MQCMIFKIVQGGSEVYDMLTRTITSFAALAVFFGALALPPVFFLAVVLLISLVMLYECFGAVKCPVNVKAVGYLSGILIFIGSCRGFYLEALSLAVAAFMVLMIVLHGKVNYKDILSPALLTVYVTTFMSFIIKTRYDYSVYEMLIIFICAWTSDTGAYFAGTFFGKHKLIPRVSPKKTVEGSAGGIIVCALSCMLYVFIISCMGKRPDWLGYGIAAFSGAIASALTQFGDLAASALKRDCGVKDYGSIFPGHGGFMDRFDSVIFIAPFVYYFISVVK